MFTRKLSVLRTCLALTLLLIFAGCASHPTKTAQHRDEDFLRDADHSGRAGMAE